MAAKLGIEIPPINDASLRSLVDMLSKVPDIAEKMSQAFVTADGVITRSRETANEKIKGEIAKLAAAGEAAAQREIASAEATAQKLAAIAAKDAEKAAALAQKTAERAAQIAAKQTERAEAESAKILAALERSKQKELESAAKADEKLAALQKKQEERANAAAQKEADRAAKSKGRTAAELEEQLNLHSKSNKEIVALQHHYAEEVADVQKKLTLTLDGEEKKRLQSTQAELKSELAAVKHEAEDRGLAEKHKSEGGEHKGGISVGEVVGIGAAVEAFKLVTEKGKEYGDAMASLKAATGKDFKEMSEAAEQIGNSMGVGGEKAAQTMAQVKNATGAEGEELKKQTEAAIAYEAVYHKSADKLMMTAQGRAKVMADAERNIAEARTKADDPAVKAQFIQTQLMETVGKLASTLLTALGPAITAIMPVVNTLGELIGTTVKPILDALTPVITKISGLFAEMAPVVTELISNALLALSPILGVISDVMGSLIPPIIGIVKTIATAMTPVMKQLGPVIQSLGGLIATQLTGVLQILLPVIQAILPPLLDALIPILMALMPVITQVANLLGGVLKIAIEAISKVLVWIVNVAIKPLIEWMGGKLKIAIDTVVGVITKAVGAITSIVNSVTSFLGLGDKAAKAATEATKGAGDAAQKEAADQAIIAEGNEKKRSMNELSAKLKAGKISAAELAKLKEQAEQDNNEVLMMQIQKFEEQKAKRAESAGKKAASAAKKTAKEKYDAERAAADEAFTDEQTAIELRIANNEITAKVGRSQTLANVAKHNESLLAIANTYHIKVKAAQLAGLKDAAAQRKDDFDNETRDIQEKEAADVEAAGDDSRKVYEIKKKSLEDQITAAKDNGQETRALEKQLASFTLAERRATTSEDKKLSQELAKFQIDQQKEEIANMKAAGMDAKVIRDAETQAAIQEEKLRFDAEIESRKHDLDNTKLGHALLEALEINHQNKLVAITKTAETEKRKEQRDTLDKITGASALYGQAEQAIHAKFFGPMLDSWKQQKTFGMQALATIAEGVLKYFEEWAAKHAAMLASQLADIVVASTASIAAAETTGAAWAPAAAFSSTATLGGAAVTGSAALAASVAGAHALGFLAEGTEYWRGGPSVIGENGPEIMNLPRGTQVIPNHKLSSVGHAPVDMSPLLSEMRSMNRTLNNVHGAVRNQRTVLPINDNIRSLFNQSEKAEARRSA